MNDIWHCLQGVESEQLLSGPHVKASADQGSKTVLPCVYGLQHPCCSTQTASEHYAAPFHDVQHSVLALSITTQGMQLLCFSGTTQTPMQTLRLVVATAGRS